MNRKFRKIAIANRGEIALRIIRAAKSMHIKTVAFFSDDEKNAPHVLQADEAFSLGNGGLNDTYLNIEKIVHLAVASGAEAIHPGYGFLSENPDFAEACQQAGIVFIGPSVEVLMQMGNKVTAKNIAKKAGLNVLESLVVKPSDVSALNKQLSFPVLIKASNGGGGKGMQVVHSADELPEKANEAARAALNYFGNDEIYIENYIEDARHIEVQVLGDNFGDIVHLYERDCTLQRKHQKIIEEAPATAISDELRNKLHVAALAICHEVGYVNAGTVEFLVDASENFYFLEMNPRIQVEHPVTEAITGIDIVQEQLSIAAGNPLSFSQTDVKVNGHAIEARVYAEDPFRNFSPSGKPVLHVELPYGEHIRIESAVDNQGGAAQFDPLLFKLIVWANKREEAIGKLITALDTSVVFGPTTNLQYLKALTETPEFYENRINTQFCNANIANLQRIIAAQSNANDEWFIAASLFFFYSQPGTNMSVWKRAGYWRMFPMAELVIGKEVHSIRFNIKNNVLSFSFNNTIFSFFLNELDISRGTMLIKNEGRTERLTFYKRNNAELFIQLKGRCLEVKNSHLLDGYNEGLPSMNDEHLIEGDVINSHLFGRVIDIPVKNNQTISKGDVLMVIESMKSENRVLSPRDARIKKINVEVGGQVTDQMPLLYLDNL